jgi:hypothetical protein
MAKVEHIINWENRVNEAECKRIVAEEQSKDNTVREATNEELDEEIQSDKADDDDFPCRSATHLFVRGEDCTVTENGKEEKIKFPAKDGWYKKGAFGLPVGEPSNYNDKDARRLWRPDGDFDCFVVRGCYWFDGNFRRCVDCVYGASSCCGVAIVREKKQEQKMIISKDLHVACPCGNIVQLSASETTAKCAACNRTGKITWKKEKK